MGLFVWYFGTRNTKKNGRTFGHHTIINGPRYRGLLSDIFDRCYLADDMSIYLHRPSITDPSVAPEVTIVSMHCLQSRISKRQLQSTGRKLEIYKNKMRKVLEETIPGFSSEVVAEHILTPEDFEKRYLSPYGAGFLLSLVFFNRPGSGHTILAKRLKTSILSVQELTQAQAFQAL